MPCEKCAELCVRYQIQQPRELRKAIDIARQNIEDGTIVELQSSSPVSQVPFSALASGAAWNDIVEHRFRCANCGELFSLHAETYHGSGGYWEPDNRESTRENL
jgi:hypothetical protein